MGCRGGVEVERTEKKTRGYIPGALRQRGERDVDGAALELAMARDGASAGFLYQSRRRKKTTNTRVWQLGPDLHDSRLHCQANTNDARQRTVFFFLRLGSALQRLASGRGASGVGETAGAGLKSKREKEKSGRVEMSVVESVSGE